MISSLLFVFFSMVSANNRQEKVKKFQIKRQFLIQSWTRDPYFETNFSFWDKFTFRGKLLIWRQGLHIETQIHFLRQNFHSEAQIRILRQNSYFETKIHILIQTLHSGTKFWSQILTFNLESFIKALEIKIQFLSQISIF